MIFHVVLQKNVEKMVMLEFTALGLVGLVKLGSSFEVSLIVLGWLYL